MKKKCSCDRIAESDPLVTSEPRRTLVTTRPPLLTPQITMKKVCSCEPGGPLCFLDPLVTYDWKKRPKRENCDLTEPDPYLEWKDVRGILPCIIIIVIGAVVVLLVFPHVFSSVLRQMEEAERLSEKLKLEKN